MKKLAIAAIVILAATGLSLFLRGRLQGQTVLKRPSNDYQSLRNLALHNSRARLGLAPTSTATEPWGVVMDWGLEMGTATVVAFSDGSANVYLSNGGGFLSGSESHESVRKAAQKMVAVAVENQRQTHPTTSYPLPRRGEIIFYLLTDAGVFTASAPLGELNSHRHPLSTLADAGMDVITQYRLIQ